MKKFFIGIDFSKQKFDATAIKAEGITETAPRVYQSFTNDTSGFREFEKWMKSESNGMEIESWLICGENTGMYSIPLSKYLYGKGYDLWIEDAYRIKHSLGIQRQKSDKSDSACIAEYAMRQQDKVSLYKPLSQALEALREVFLFRHKLVQEKTDLAVRINEKKSVLGESGGVAFMKSVSERLLESFDKAIAECDAEMQRLIDSDEELKENYKIVTSIKGIGLQNASAMLVYTDNFNKFDYDARRLACYYGIAPFGKDSGTSVHVSPHTSKMANKMLKALLSEAAKCAIRFCPEMKAYYERLIANGKAVGVALNNVKNKLLHFIMAMVKNRQVYDPEYQKKKQAEKMSGKLVLNKC